MDAALLGRLFGREQGWKGPCTVIVNADAVVQTTGHDSVAGGGNKVYAPRVISGRIMADGVSMLKDGTGLILIQQVKIRQATGEEIFKQSLFVVDPAQVVAIEFPDNSALASVGLPVPIIKASGSHPGTQRPAFESAG